MVVFLLKSSACLAIFLMFYKLLLERESMHTFKRYYLLAALIIAFVIPSITFVEYIEITPSPISYETPAYIPTETVAPLVIEKPAVFNWAIFLWTIYVLGVLFFSIRFLKNLLGIARNIRNNPKLRIEELINVLLQEATVPHTFFNYIFLDRKKFEENAIPKEVLLHEATHAKQKHSLDILFVELLQITFWFNPLLYITKKSIKLNHEFLADQAVLHNGTDMPQYQNLLLAFASSTNAQDYQSSLANAVNYSSIKKRFTVMKTRTSKKSILMRSILLLPLLTLLVFGFSETKRIELEKSLPDVIIQESNEDETSFIPNQNKPTSNDFEKWGDKNEFAIWIHEKPVDNSVLDDYRPKDFAHYFLSFVYQNARSERFPQPYQLHLYTQDEFEKNVVNDNLLIEVMVNKNGQLLVQSELVELDNLASYLLKLNKNLSKVERQKTIRGVIVSDKSAPKEVIAAVERILNEYGVAQIDIRGAENRPPPAQNGATQKQLSKYNTLAKKYNAQPKEKRVIPSKDLRSLEYIYRKMSEQQKADALPFPECPDSKSNGQEGATEKQMAEYNALAKKYNELLADGGNIRIRKFDVDRLEYLHGIMNEEQRANVEPFPDFPQPPEPPAPPSPADPHAKEFAENKIQEIIANQDPHDHPIGLNYSMVKRGKPQESIETYPKVNSYFDAENENNTIYHNGKKINYLEMMRLQKEGEIKSINVFKNAVGQDIISITGLNEPTNATSFQNLEKDTSFFNYPYKPKKNDILVPTPPTPPKPKSPMDYVIEMAKKDAKFYYKGKEISSDKAIDLIKKNKNLNIDSKTEKGKRPIVKLSTEPIQIKD